MQSTHLESNEYASLHCFLNFPLGLFPGIVPLCQALSSPFIDSLVKAALMARSPKSHWIHALPLVLLGICSALKEDIACTSAELVYRTTLRLPRVFFPMVGSTNIADATSYATRLTSAMEEIQAVQPQLHRQHWAQTCRQQHTSSSNEMPYARLCNTRMVDHSRSWNMTPNLSSWTSMAERTRCLWTISSWLTLIAMIVHGSTLTPNISLHVWQHYQVPMQCQNCKPRTTHLGCRVRCPDILVWDVCLFGY